MILNEELIQTILLPLRECGELRQRGSDEVVAECRRTGKTASLVPKVLEIGVKADVLAKTLSSVLDVPSWPLRAKPSQIDALRASRGDDITDAPEPQPSILKVDQDYVICDNQVMYVKNPLDEDLIQDLIGRHSGLRTWGVISHVQLVRLADQEDTRSRQERRASGMEAPKGQSLIRRLSGASRLDEAPADTDAQVELDDLLRMAAAMNASDVHFDPGPIEVGCRMRIDGDLNKIKKYEYRDYLPIANLIISRAKGKPGSYGAPLDGMFVFELPGPRKIKLRVMMVPVILPDREDQMPKIVLRLLGNVIEQIALAEIGIPSWASNDQYTQLQLLMERKAGLILVSGPTGSGKTTTLSAIQREMIRTHPNRVYYTIEDPVEISIASVNHVQVNLDAELSFAKGLKSFLRGDPDVIMVGEIRDMEAASQALTASITGHLVLSTIHTNSAIETAIRLIDMGCDSFIVASALKASTAQRLVKRLCQACALDVAWDDLVAGRHSILDHRDNRLMRLRYANAPRAYHDLDFFPEGHRVKIRGPGCSSCNRTGIRGRTMVSELFVLTRDIAEVISQKAPYSTVKAIAEKSGFKDLWQHAMYLVSTGAISFDDAVADIGERDMQASVERPAELAVSGQIIVPAHVRATPVSFDARLMQELIVTSEQVQEEQGFALTAEKKGELLVALYEIFRESSTQVDRGIVSRMTRLASPAL